MDARGGRIASGKALEKESMSMEDVQLEQLKMLRSIDATLKQILAARKSAPASGGAAVAPASDLDSQYGDPEVRNDPRDWSGPSMKGRKLSECPADYLDMWAEMKDYFAGKERSENKMTSKGNPAWEFSLKDAARARGWSARIRAGLVEQKPEPESDFGKGGAW
jgi:hypothetical protein